MSTTVIPLNFNYHQWLLPLRSLKGFKAWVIGVFGAYWVIARAIMVLGDWQSLFPEDLEQNEFFPES